MLFRSSERFVSLVCALFLGGTPWILRAVDRLSDAGTGVTQALAQLGANPTHVCASETVNAAVRARATDWEAACALGIAQKRQGKLDAAIRSLRQAAAAVPAGSAEAGLVANNLGNALFASGRPASA